MFLRGEQHTVYKIKFLFISNLDELQTTILLYILYSKRIVNISLTRIIVPSTITANMTTAYTDLISRDCDRHGGGEHVGTHLPGLPSAQIYGYDPRFLASSKIGYVFCMGWPPHFFSGYWERDRKLGPNLYAKI